jgi:glutaredoxin
MPTDPDDIHVYGYPEGCPACDLLKALLYDLGLSYTFHHLHPQGPLREALRREGFSTVPQVFSREGVHLGDYQALKKALTWPLNKPLQ